MSDNFDEHARTFNRHGGIGGLAAEIDALRAEIERLGERLRLADMMADSDEYDVLRQMSTENERLKETIERGSNANAALEIEIERLRADLKRGKALVEEMDTRMPEHATEDTDGFIASYRIPVGPWHRLLGWARGG